MLQFEVREDHTVLLWTPSRGKNASLYGYLTGILSPLQFVVKVLLVPDRIGIPALHQMVKLSLNTEILTCSRHNPERAHISVLVHEYNGLELQLFSRFVPH